MDASSPDEPAYVHGTTPAEQARLGRLNDLLNRLCLREIQPSETDLALEVGAGTGHFARTLEPKVRSVVAVERDSRQLREARRSSSSVDLREGDARALPLGTDEWGTFDLVHARFVLEHSDRPEDIAAQMARAARPGGRVVVIDDDYEQFRLWPPAPTVERAWQAFLTTLVRMRLDPAIGRRLPEILASAGLEPIRTAVITFGGCAGQPEFDALVTNFQDLLDGATEHVERHGAGTAALIESAIAELEEWRHQRGAALWYLACYAEARRPER